mmetsp:Transcript_26130/g.65307  ORF Transcript_26130/g.65307 Transcript_26130/m.65307 type:complete len:215 (-) Transcript_26130:1274-1918(-)
MGQDISLAQVRARLMGGATSLLGFANSPDVFGSAMRVELAELVSNLLSQTLELPVLLEMLLQVVKLLHLTDHKEFGRMRLYRAIVDAMESNLEEPEPNVSLTSKLFRLLECVEEAARTQRRVSIVCGDDAGLLLTMLRSVKHDQQAVEEGLECLTYLAEDVQLAVSFIMENASSCMMDISTEFGRYGVVQTYVVGFLCCLAKAKVLRTGHKLCI